MPEIPVKICPVCSKPVKFGGRKASGGFLSGGEWFEWVCEKCGHVERDWILHY